MKPSVIAAVLTLAALPVLAQTSPAPTDPRPARVEVSDPAATSQKASKPAKATKTAKKSKKKKAKQKPQSVG